MTYQEKLLSEFTVEELDRELVAGAAQIPGEKQFKNRGQAKFSSFSNVRRNSCPGPIFPGF